MKMSSRGVWLFPVLAAGLCLARQPRADVRPLSVSATLPAQRSAVAVPDEDAAILSSILRKQFYGWQHAFVLRRETLPLKQLSDISSLDVSRRGLNADAVREAIQDFKRRNAASHTVPALDIGKPLKVVAGSDIDKIFEHHWWEDFYKKYPHTDGFLEVSLPGFSANHQTALVYVARHSDGLNAEGAWAVLVKKQGKWTRQEILGGWVS